MSMNSTPNANRSHIGFFGSTNAGKSSLVNAVTNQPLSIVSSVSGTTTDPVQKAMELLPFGPVVIIDTPGFDDCSILGELRIKKTKEILAKCDLAVLVSSAKDGLSDTDTHLLELFRNRGVPFVICYNKADESDKKIDLEENAVYTSAVDGVGIDELKNLMAKVLSKTVSPEKPIISDLVSENDLVILVVPIDSSAPKGRIILPQQQVIRDGLDVGAEIMVVKETSLAYTLESIGRTPKLIITDSQVFGKVMKIVPREIPLTSFSILMARYKGFLDEAVKGAMTLDKLCDKSRVLISEGCSHHRQCEDIGTVKLPGWIKNYTQKDIEFSFTQGTDFPEDLSEFDLVIHCGGCMLTEREVIRRRKQAEYQNVPFTNYGTTIAHINGILGRSIEML